MKYELAKELKKAGFPQSGEGRPYSIVAQMREDDICLDGKENVYYPTLSELIEACGEDFARLSFVAVDGPEWEATGAPPGIELLRKIGRTPNEAVARLWLALQVDNPTASPIR